MSSLMGASIPQPVVTQTIQNKSSVIETSLLNARGKRFEQTKATKIYGMFAGLKFGFITFKDNHKGRFFSVTNEELEARDLYNQHKELHVLISRVQKAYKDYLPAVQAVKEVKHKKNSTKPSKNLNDALRNRSTKSVALVASYDELMVKANSQVGDLRNKDIDLLGKNLSLLSEKDIILLGNNLSELNVSRRDDLHDALALKNPGILNAIHSSQAQTSVMNEIDRTALDKDKLNAFMLNFENEVQKASSRSGAAPDAVSQAFIDGLINTPGIDNKVIFSYVSGLYAKYDAIQKNAKNPTSNAYFVDMTSHFASAINSLINSQKEDITPAVISQISYDGIFMTDLMSLSAEELSAKLVQLKEWKQLESNQTSVDAAVQLYDTQLQTAKAEYAAPVIYTVQEIADLLGKNGLKRLLNEPVAILVKDNEPVAINEYIEGLSQYNEAIKEADELIQKHSSERKAAIASLEEELILLDKAAERVKQYAGTIAQALLTVDETTDVLNPQFLVGLENSTIKKIDEALKPLKEKLEANKANVARVKARITQTKEQDAVDVKKEDSTKLNVVALRDALKDRQISITVEQLVEIKGIMYNEKTDVVITDEKMDSANACFEKIFQFKVKQLETLQTQATENKRIEELRPAVAELSSVFDNLADGSLAIKPEFFAPAKIEGMYARRTAAIESAADRTSAVLDAFEKRQSELRGQYVDNEDFNGSQEQFLAKRQAAVAPTVPEAQHIAEKNEWDEKRKLARASSAPSVLSGKNAAVGQTFAEITQPAQKSEGEKQKDTQARPSSAPSVLSGKIAAVGQTFTEITQPAQKSEGEKQKDTQARASSAPSVSNSDTFFDLEAF